jgi:hemolysin activation/secretion protein
MQLSASRSMRIAVAAGAFACIARTDPAAAQQKLATLPIQLAQAGTPQPQTQLTLKGIRLVDTAAKIEAGGANETGISIVGLPMLDDPALKQQLNNLLGKPLVQDMLGGINTVLVNWYRDHDRPFVDVAFPAGQDVTNGVVQVVVTESKVGQVVARNNHWFSSGLLTSQVQLSHDDPISLRELQADRDWLNLNPFRSVDITAERSPTPGYTDIVVNTLDEQFPLRGHLTYDDTGASILGRDRWSAGIDWGNAFWTDSQLSYQYSSNVPLHRSVSGAAADYEAHSLSLVTPLPWHDQLAIFGAYARSTPRLGPDLGLTGINWQLSGRYIVTLPPSGNFSQQAQFGFDFKSSNSNLLFGGFEVLNTTSEIAQFTFDYSAALKDPLGQTSLGNSLVVSPGGLTALNKDANFAAQMPSARARYVYDHISLSRLSGLPQDRDWVKGLGWFGGVSWLTRVTGQIASDDLLPSEELGLGGMDTVPGYDQRDANGTFGFLVSEELFSPPFSIAKILFGDAPGDQAQFSLFWDQGGVRNKAREAGAHNLNDLSSAGVGFRYVVGRYVNLHADYGWQLHQLPGTPKSSRFDILLTLTY